MQKGDGVRVLFLSQDRGQVEQLVTALRIPWPELSPMTASRGDTGLRLVEQAPALAVLWGHLSDMDLGSAIEGVRSRTDIPIVAAAERSGEAEVVRALEMGADDFIRLPCSLLEVMARVMALMRRVGLTRLRGNGGPIRRGDLLIDPGTHEVSLGSRRLALTPTEFKLLHLLAKNSHVTLSQRFIQRVIWADEVAAREALKKYIQRLRRKLGDDARDPTWIQTVHGVGYRLSSPAPSAS